MLDQIQHRWAGRYHHKNPRSLETARGAAERVVVVCLAGMRIPRDSDNSAAASYHIFRPSEKAAPRSAVFSVRLDW
jgi:hypothetical protein